jgi:probable F420-dependent oxidoreductase
MTVSAVLGLWQDRDPLEALETAKLADELGFPELWIGEMATFDAFALAAAIGGRTERIPLTVGPLAVGVRDPMAMAMGVASVAALARRPVHLALGSSSPVVVEDWHGQLRHRSPRHIEECIGALRPLLAGERADFHGELVRTHGYRLRLEPPATSLTVAAFGERTIRVAARLADRMVINLSTPEVARRLRERLDEAAGEAERERPRLAAWVVASVDPGEETFLQIARGLTAYLAAPGYADVFRSAGFGELVDFARGRPGGRQLIARIPADLCRAVGLVGSYEEVRARLAEYRDAGVDEVAIAPATAGDPAGRRTLEALSPSGRGA